jgi:hypothetical protein
MKMAGELIEAGVEVAKPVVEQVGKTVVDVLSENAVGAMILAAGSLAFLAYTAAKNPMKIKFLGIEMDSRKKRS